MQAFQASHLWKKQLVELTLQTLSTTNSKAVANYKQTFSSNMVFVTQTVW